MGFEINNLDHKSGETTVVWGAEVRSCVKRRGAVTQLGFYGNHVKGCVERRM